VSQIVPFSHSNMLLGGAYMWTQYCRWEQESNHGTKSSISIHQAFYLMLVEQILGGQSCINEVLLANGIYKVGQYLSYAIYIQKRVKARKCQNRYWSDNCSHKRCERRTLWHL